MTKTPTEGKTEWLDKFNLTGKQRLFVLHYLETMNAMGSAREAGYKHPKMQGHENMENPRIRKAIKEGRAQVEDKVMISAERVARMWLDHATADPNDISQNRIAACRHCHGIDHEYQWRTPREYREARVAAIYAIYDDPDLRDAAMAGQIEDARIPTDAGGYGYRATMEPAPDCPECDGEGVEIVRMADTRNLSPGARMLYDGVEETRQGKKIRTTDRAAALERLAKHLGMFAGKVEDETTNPLTRLVERMVSSANAVPVAGQDKTPDQDGKDE